MTFSRNRRLVVRPIIIKGGVIRVFRLILFIAYNTDSVSTQLLIYNIIIIINLFILGENTKIASNPKNKNSLKNEI